MASFLPATTDRIHDLASELVLSLELSRGEGCDLAATAQAAERLAREVHGVLVAAEAVDEAGSTARIDETCRTVESAYSHWKSVDVAFTQTLRLAYENQVPRTNLLLDDIHAGLRQRVGEPVAEAYTDLRARWAAHVASRPWDTYLNRAPQHVDRAALETALSGLARGDDLDVEDALAAITGPLRHAFADHLRDHADDLNDLEIGLWRRPEILVAGDYWGHPKRHATARRARRKRAGAHTRGGRNAGSSFFGPPRAGAAPSSAICRTCTNPSRSASRAVSCCTPTTKCAATPPTTSTSIPSGR